MVEIVPHPKRRRLRGIFVLIARGMGTGWTIAGNCIHLTIRVMAKPKMEWRPIAKAKEVSTPPLVDNSTHDS
ncbi:hypothetical protein KI387_025146, partial [Taxus chinensis]